MTRWMPLLRCTLVAAAVVLTLGAWLRDAHDRQLAAPLIAGLPDIPDHRATAELARRVSERFAARLPGTQRATWWMSDLDLLWAGEGCGHAARAMTALAERLGWDARLLQVGVTALGASHVLVEVREPSGRWILVDALAGRLVEDANGRALTLAEIRARDRSEFAYWGADVARDWGYLWRTWRRTNWERLGATGEAWSAVLPATMSLRASTCVLTKAMPGLAAVLALLALALPRAARLRLYLNPAGMAVLALCVTVLVWPPSGLTMGDEVRYLEYARSMRDGHWPHGLGLVPRYPYLWSVVLAAGWTWMGPGVVWMGIVGWLGLLAGLAADARRRGVHLWIAFAAAALPSLWLFGRTLMSDVPCAALLLAATLALEGRRPVWALPALLAAVLMRTAAIVPALALVVGWMFEQNGQGRRRRRLGLGLVALVAVGWLANNTWIWGSPLATGYPAEPDMLALENLGRSGVVLAVSLCVLPPLLLPVGLWRLSAERRWGRLALVGANVALQSVYYFVDILPTWPATLVSAQRLVLPAVAVLVLPWSEVVVRKATRVLGARWAWRSVLLLAVISLATVSWAHTRVGLPHAGNRTALCAEAAGRRLIADALASRVAVFCTEAASWASVNAERVAIAPGDAVLTTRVDPSLRRPSGIPLEQPDDAHCRARLTTRRYDMCIAGEAFVLERRAQSATR